MVRHELYVTHPKYGVNMHQTIQSSNQWHVVDFRNYTKEATFDLGSIMSQFDLAKVQFQKEVIDIMYSSSTRVI